MQLFSALQANCLLKFLKLSPKNRPNSNSSIKPELRYLTLKDFTILFNRSTFLGIYRFSFFFFLFLISRYLYYYFDKWPFLENLIQQLANFLAQVILEVSVLFFSLFYSDVSTIPNGIITISGQEVLQIIYGCTGIIQLFQITFILLFYPIKWRQKIYLFPLSIIIIFSATIVHFLILVPIAYHLPEYFSVFHDYTLRIFFFGIVFLTWLFWEKVRVEEKHSSNFHKDRLTLQPTHSLIKKILRFSILGVCILIVPFIPLIGSTLKSNIEWISEIFYFDKILYYLLYATLCFVALWACFTLIKTISNFIYVIILSGIFGIIMGAINQHLFLRINSDISLDILINLSGVITGALLFYFHLIYKYTNYFKLNR